MHAPATTKGALRAALAAASHDMVRGAPERLSVDQARLLQLGAWCYHTAAPGSPHRQQLALDFARDWQQHQQRATVVLPLLQAWQRAGIRAVVFKGFALAWGVYPHPALRFCGDADVLLSRADAQRALQLPVPGWHLIVQPPLGDQRAAFLAYHPASGHTVDVQHDLLPAHGLRRWPGCSLTTRMLADADLHIPVATGAGGAGSPGGAGGRAAGASMLALRPDDLLLALAINRCWGADAFRNKPHDYQDLALTIQRHGLQADALAQRARQLGVLPLWQAFLRHCNPFTRHFDLIATRDHRLQRLRNQLCPAPQGLPMTWGKVLQRGRRSVRVLHRAAQALPTALGVLRDLRRYPTPSAASAAAPAAPARRATPWQPWQAEQAAGWALRLLAPLARRTDAGPCVQQSLTVLRLLQKHGHAANWCLGYRPAVGNAPVAHAWVETADPYAFGLEAHLHNTRYQVVLRNGPPLQDPER